MSWGGNPLVVENLKKSYRKRSGEEFLAVKGISFEVREGECFGLLGPNGAGKSTSIDCIIGFYPPTAGRVLINGISVHDNPKLARQQLGVCPQEDNLDTDFHTMDQMIRHATYYRIPVREAKVRAAEVLKQFGLFEKSKDLVEHLSGGMRRRLQVARALISNPRVLVLDEPTTGLDPEARRSLWDVLVECRAQGKAVLLSTHYMDEAERLCDRVAILHQGQILDLASPRELIDKHIGTAQVEEEIRPGIVWKRLPNLEDVFLKLAGSKLG